MTEMIIARIVLVAIIACTSGEVLWSCMAAPTPPAKAVEFYKIKPSREVVPDHRLPTAVQDKQQLDQKIDALSKSLEELQKSTQDLKDELPPAKIEE